VSPARGVKLGYGDSYFLGYADSLLGSTAAATAARAHGRFTALVRVCPVRGGSRAAARALRYIPAPLAVVRSWAPARSEPASQDRPVWRETGKIEDRRTQRRQRCQLARCRRAVDHGQSPEWLTRLRPLDLARCSAAAAGAARPSPPRRSDPGKAGQSSPSAYDPSTRPPRDHRRQQPTETCSPKHRARRTLAALLV
jgi:hypothetical protein